MGTWTETTVAGHPCDVFEPARTHEQGFALVYLHGVHQQRLVDNAAYTGEFERHGLRVVAPMTRRSWWTDRICAEFDPKLTAERHVLDNVVPLVAARWGVRPPGIGLFGTSMGGQGALRLAYKHPNLFPVVAGVSPAIDYHQRFEEGDETLPLMYADREAARQDTAILHVHPLNWPRRQFFCCDPADERWFDSADRLRMKLWSLGVPHECDLETGIGGQGSGVGGQGGVVGATGGAHGFGYYNLMARRVIGFLVNGLEHEQRRVVDA